MQKRDTLIAPDWGRKGRSQVTPVRRKQGIFEKYAATSLAVKEVASFDATKFNVELLSDCQTL